MLLIEDLDLARQDPQSLDDLSPTPLSGNTIEEDSTTSMNTLPTSKTSPPFLPDEIWLMILKHHMPSSKRVTSSSHPSLSRMILYSLMLTNKQLNRLAKEVYYSRVCRIFDLERYKNTVFRFCHGCPNFCDMITSLQICLPVEY